MFKTFFFGVRFSFLSWVAFIVPGGNDPIELSSLRQALARRLPSYMVGVLANLSGLGDEVATFRSGSFTREDLGR